MIKAILFDLDGTLINTNELIIKSFQHTFKKCLNKDILRDEIILTFGEPLRDALAKFDEEKVEILLSTYREFNESKHDSLAYIFEGVENGINDLKQLGTKIAIVTSKRRELAVRGLKLIGIYDYIDVIVAPEDTEKHKPLGEPAEKACELLNIEPREAIMVGDSHNDILCGNNAGCKTCVVKYTYLPMEGIMKYKPHYVIDSIEELALFCKDS